MATTNRASLSDTYIAPPLHQRHGESLAYRADAETPRRTLMVVGGFFLALVSLAMGSLALVQVWLAPSTPTGVEAPALQSWEATAMIIAGGVGFAAGAALVGIGMGRWTSPRPPESEADYTGPGEDVHDAPQPPRVV